MLSTGSSYVAGIMKKIYIMHGTDIPYTSDGR